MNKLNGAFASLMVVSLLLSACQPNLTEITIFTPTPAPPATLVVQNAIAPPESDDPRVGGLTLPTELAPLVALDSGAGSPIEPVEGLPSVANIEWVSVARGFNTPTAIVNAGDGSRRLFVVEQNGMIWEMDENFVRRQTPFLDISSRVSVGFEQGMWSLAFHPDYEANGYLYVLYTNLIGSTVVSRFITDRNTNRPNPVTELILLTAAQPAENHNGGQIAFGPDGYLYIGLGDGGAVNDPWDNAQSVETRLGKLLRVNIDSGARYGIPADNPFPNSAAPENWAIGLQNPWRFSFDPLTGDIYIGDVGQTQWQEINFLAFGAPGGANFGWDFYEGDEATGAGSPDREFSAPVAVYDINERGCAVVGGEVYRGENLPQWRGIYFFADFCTGSIWAAFPQVIEPETEAETAVEEGAEGEESEGAPEPEIIWRSQLIFTLDIWISAFGHDEARELYFLDYENGDIYRLERR